MDEISLKTCEMCKEKLAYEFCMECEQSFCWNCADYHKNITMLKNHRSVKLCDGEPKNQSELNLFCAKIDDFLELTMINSHNKNELKTKELGIKNRLLKWKEEVKNITNCRSEYMKGLVIDEEKWSVKKEEILEIKTELENNFQEFIEFLQYKQKIECDKIESEINQIEQKLIHYKEKINKNKSKLKENETAITKKMKLNHRYSREMTNYKLLQMHPPPNLQHPIPMDDLCNLSPPTKTNEMEVVKAKRGKNKVSLEGCEQMTNNEINLKESEAAITGKLKLKDTDSEEVTSDTLSPLNPPLNLPFPVPMDDLCNLSPSTKTNEMEIIKTAKGGKKLLLDGYAFLVHKQKRENVTYWICEKNCGGRLVMKNGQVTKMNQHNHPPDPVRNICLKAVDNMTLEAQVSSDSARTIVRKHLSLLPLEAVTSLPLKESLARQLSRKRNSLYVIT